MATRYFKFTDGERTYFRTSASRVYLSGWSVPTGSNGFSIEPVANGRFPVVEIEAKEYQALQVTKKKRLLAAGWQHLDCAAAIDSWIWNHDLTGAELTTKQAAPARIEARVLAST
jgi:hypothetical protein